MSIECRDDLPIYDLCLNQGSTTSLSLLFGDDDDNPIDLTGSTLHWKMKDNYDSTTYLIEANSTDVVNSRIEIADQTTNKGEAILIISGNDTALLTPRVTDVHSFYQVDTNDEPIYWFKGQIVFEAT